MTESNQNVGSFMKESHAANSIIINPPLSPSTDINTALAKDDWKKGLERIGEKRVPPWDQQKYIEGLKQWQKKLGDYYNSTSRETKTTLLKTALLYRKFNKGTLKDEEMEEFQKLRKWAESMDLVMTMSGIDPWEDDV